MIVEPDSAHRSPATGRSVAVLAAWYAAPIIAIIVWAARQPPAVEPVRQCTAKTLACFRWTTGDTVGYLLVPVLVSAVLVSAATLTYLRRNGTGPGTAGSVAAVAGWIGGPILLILLVILWFLAIAAIRTTGT